MKAKHLPTLWAVNAFLAGSLFLASCQDGLELPDLFSYPSFAEASDPKVLSTAPNGTLIYGGGFGSSIAADPHDPKVFYLLTDRGPNAAGTAPNSIILGKADFAPQIGKFRVVNKRLVLEQTILLKNVAGQSLTGLPNPAGQGSTGESAFNLNGQPLAPDPEGIDSEGLVLATDGTFWVSDEYGPHLAHFDATGRTLERINPFGTGTGGRKLPLVLALRRPNRGMEGLTITPDGKTLVGLMQSPLYNPSSAAVSGSTVIRVVTFDIATGATKQYAYLMENASLTGCSEIAAITNTTFLALERDGNYGGSPTAPATFKRVYKFDLAGATDISDPTNTAAGKLYNGLTVEQLKDKTGLQNAGVVPVTKTLVFDLLTDISPVYPHDKAEGLALLPDNQLAISNDDDFGVVDNGQNGFAPKTLPATGQVDKNRIYFVKLKTPLK
ncbi:esterase-like activity of phytase family protein [Hymenobacter sp. GOD-10R]|uniref:esterase-like activity of phytase family protein n=1 Tax=Hymenobacter sp. GOD-10R TaxID=3093922 RepID=UPI002D792446|nr:esterase-like activity of phytase family protein [Hymenobacter sp. GOD-10R]WRQ26176.1 esterase-like activity of phytase family protein [Hymenobacter sp. GOD-10R]